MSWGAAVASGVTPLSSSLSSHRHRAPRRRCRLYLLLRRPRLRARCVLHRPGDRLHGPSSCRSLDAASASVPVTCLQQR
ncbi:hypothetical protein K466DRAFT_668470 [Polyporus arcularius HHB13444]|uniref:Uncharacterized protein n=1 Tax=Polyporus arcularius HHB13444 TaxID=1314778 RepID=A0A5C3NNY8_9APHY|nr:hypothetical protein K466DRAFT_668470 [Polyporus arcularius HHB13444]